jgi:hypothetical protein
MSTAFLKTNEGKELIWLDYCGYHLTDRQEKMTVIQSAVIAKGRMNLFNEMNKSKK